MWENIPYYPLQESLLQQKLPGKVQEVLIPGSDRTSGVDSLGFGAVVGVTFGDTLASEVFSEKETFPFRALKSDMIVFLATILH